MSEQSEQIDISRSFSSSTERKKDRKYNSNWYNGHFSIFGENEKDRKLNSACYYGSLSVVKSMVDVDIDVKQKCECDLNEAIVYTRSYFQEQIAIYLALNGANISLYNRPFADDNSIKQLAYHGIQNLGIHENDVKKYKKSSEYIEFLEKTRVLLDEHNPLIPVLSNIIVKYFT